MHQMYVCNNCIALSGKLILQGKEPQKNKTKNKYIRDHCHKKGPKACFFVEDFNFYDILYPAILTH